MHHAGQLLQSTIMIMTILCHLLPPPPTTAAAAAAAVAAAKTKQQLRPQVYVTAVMVVMNPLVYAPTLVNKRQLIT